MNILVFGAHGDDEVIGVGGTIAKYAHEKHNVTTVIFSRGDKSSPWLKEEVIVKLREEEAKNIDKFIGSKKLILLGLDDQKLNTETQHPDIKRKVKNIIKKYKPNKVFVHSSKDFHPDHIAVNKVVMEILEEIDPKKKISAYTYEIGNIINETKPRIYIDISNTFKKKIQAMRMFKSQHYSIFLTLIPVYYKAIISGFHNGCRYAERFYKER